MNLETQLQQLSQRSEYTREILGRPPAWLLRWGSIVVCLWVMGLIGLSWLIRYPDIVPAPITLTTEQPPLRTVARVGGELLILAPTATHVQAGEVVAMIRNTVTYTDLAAAQQKLALLTALPEWPTHLAEHLPQLRVAFQRLGTLQPAFNTFLTEAERFVYQQSTQSLPRRIQALQQESAERERLLQQQRAQLNVIHRQRALSQQAMARSEALHRQQLLPQAQLEQQQQEHLQTESNESQQRALIAAAAVELAQLQREQLNLELTEAERDAQLRQSLLSAYHALLGSIAKWEADYLLQAPVAGRLSWSDYWSSHQYVKAGSEVFTVVPTEGHGIIGRLALPMWNSGKVKPGQTVNIKLEGFPHTQYGVLTGTIKSIAPAPAGQHYDIRVTVPQTLQTSHGQQLSFRQEMQGTADIVTEDIRLLERVFYQLWRALG